MKHTIIEEFVEVSEVDFDRLKTKQPVQTVLRDGKLKPRFYWLRATKKRHPGEGIYTSRQGVVKDCS